MLQTSHSYFAGLGCKYPSWQTQEPDAPEIKLAFLKAVPLQVRHEDASNFKLHVRQVGSHDWQIGLTPSWTYLTIQEHNLVEALYILKSRDWLHVVH